MSPESFGRDIATKFQFCVIDESESIVVSFHNENTMFSRGRPAFHSALGNFGRVVRDSECVVLMDAQLSNMTFTLGTMLRPAQTSHFYINRGVRFKRECTIFMSVPKAVKEEARKILKELETISDLSKAREVTKNWSLRMERFKCFPVSINAEKKTKDEIIEHFTTLVNSSDGYKLWEDRLLASVTSKSEKTYGVWTSKTRGYTFISRLHEEAKLLVAKLPEDRRKIYTELLCEDDYCELPKKLRKVVPQGEIEKQIFTLSALGRRYYNADTTEPLDNILKEWGEAKHDIPRTIFTSPSITVGNDFSPSVEDINNGIQQFTHGFAYQ